jgi:Orsellinic acid/F9775 biosynthesis cluster protein D
VNEELKILICLTCRHGLESNHKLVIKHFTDHHCAKGQTIEKLQPGLSDRLRRVLDGMSFAIPAKVKNQPHDRAPIPWLQVRRGFYCPVVGPDGRLCLYTGGKVGTIATHLKTKHQGDQARPHVQDIESYPCDYQTLFTGNLRQFFRVKTGLAGLEANSDPQRNPYLAFMRQVNATSSSEIHPEPINDDELPSLLRATRWNDFLWPYRKNPKDVVALVQHPTPRWASGMTGEDRELERILCKLPDISEIWMDITYKRWKGSSEYVWRILARYPM